jgi:hypothetical protein
MSPAQQLDPKTETLSRYHTIFELEAALKVPRPTDEKGACAIRLALADHARRSRQFSDLDCHRTPLTTFWSLSKLGRLGRLVLVRHDNPSAVLPQIEYHF